MRPAAANRNRRDRQAPLQRACRSLSCVWKERNICFVRTLFAFARREAVLTISFCCALLSMLAVPPDAGYADYIDLRVLCLLFCLMAVVAGLQQCGLFALLAQRLLSGRRPLRVLYLVLVLLPFFTSMLVTNDVALLTFVPFSVLVLGHIGRPEALIRVVVLQTLAANLGSMATPVGNPQNLFLCSAFALPLGDFLSVVLPPALISLLALAAAALATRGGTVEISFPERARITQPRLFALLCGLFALCLLSVVHVLHYLILTAIVALCLLLCARGLFRQVDYALLATFVCFFVFAGNVGRIEAVRAALESLMRAGAYGTSLLASQVISNVPAAVLLAGFTDNWRALLAGVNIGGLGTPIASLASLISLKLYLRAEHASLPRYLAVFTAANAAGLAVLSAAAALLGLL